MKKNCLILIFLIFLIKVTGQNNINVSNGFVFDGEPYLVINPNNANHITIAWMGWKENENLVIKTKTSFDGGNTWSSVSTLPHIVEYFTSADPTMAYGNDNTIYLAFIDYNYQYLSSPEGGIYLYSSNNGGLDWNFVSKVMDANDDTTKFPIDRPWLSTDTSGNIFITSTNAKGASPPYHPYLSISNDFGTTFTWKYIDTTNWLVGELIPQPMPTNCISKDGTLYIAYPSYLPTQNIFPRYILAKTSDYGSSFEYNTMFNIFSALNDTLVKKSHLILSNPSNPQHLVFLYLTKEFGDIDVALGESYDKGQNWTPPIRINDDTQGNKKIQDLIWADFDADGDLVIAWRDRRNGTDTTYTTGYEIYATYRKNGNSTFVPNFPISDTIIQYHSILSQSGNDFMCIKVLNDTTYAVWGDTRNGKLNIWLSKFIINNQQSFQQIKVNEEPIIYPIPTNKDKIYFKNIKPKFYEILSLDGNVIRKKHIYDNSISIKGLKKGIYILKLTCHNEKTFIRKILIR